MAATTTSTSTTATESPRNGLPSAWAKVVVKGTGDSSENTESISKDDIPANECNVPKKPAWNIPPNTVSPPPTQSLHHPPPAVVMGAGSSLWPALSDSTRIHPKSVDSFKSVKDSSVGPTTSNPQEAKQGSANAHQNSNVNSAPPTRQKSMKRGGGSSGSGNRQGVYFRDPPPPPPLPVPEVAQSSFSKVVPVAGSDSSSRDTRPTGGYASHSNSSNDHPNHRGSNRRGGRGNGRNNYHGGRRDQDHGNHDWSSPASPQGRGSHGNHHRPQGRGFMGSPVQVPPPFVQPSTMRPYGNAVVYPDPGVVYIYQPLPADSFRGGMTYLTGPPPPYLVPPEHLRVQLIAQIEYYFSDANLVKDPFLRSKMDEQGWVPITLIASFPRVQNLSDNIPFILECMSSSTCVEVQGDKIRIRDKWAKWIPREESSKSASQSLVGSEEKLTVALQKVSLEENQPESVLN